MLQDTLPGGKLKEFLFSFRLAYCMLFWNSLSLIGCVRGAEAWSKLTRAGPCSEAPLANKEWLVYYLEWRVTFAQGAKEPDDYTTIPTVYPP